MLFVFGVKREKTAAAQSKLWVFVWGNWNQRVKDCALKTQKSLFQLSQLLQNYTSMILTIFDILIWLRERKSKKHNYITFSCVVFRSTDIFRQHQMNNIYKEINSQCEAKRHLHQPLENDHAFTMLRLCITLDMISKQRRHRVSRLHSPVLTLETHARNYLGANTIVCIFGKTKCWQKSVWLDKSFPMT